MCLGMWGCMSITVYCCCCLSHWALPCSCGPSTGPHCLQHPDAEASSRWSGPDLWPPRNCWSDAVGRSLGWLQRQAGTHAPTHRHANMHAELIFNKTFSRILCIQTSGSFERNSQNTENGLKFQTTFYSFMKCESGNISKTSIRPLNTFIWVHQ